MDASRLQQILDGFDKARILVVGDFFLDKYLILDAGLTELSIETGLDAYQVVGKRLSPGAAGTVTSNLRALDAGTVYALGMIGRDGEGFELRAGLEQTGVVTDLLVESDARFTPTYTKPMLREAGVERELNRLDIKNREPLPAEVEREIIARLRRAAPEVDAVIVADQVQERNCGIITDAVRAELAALSRQYPRAVFIADSRTRIGEFRDLWIKPNCSEALRAAGPPLPPPHALGNASGSPHARGSVPAAPHALGNASGSPHAGGNASGSPHAGESVPAAEEVLAAGRALQQRNGRPLFLTLAENGILAIAAGGAWHVPTLRQTGPIDICGAGDSVMAGVTLALCSGAAPEEAAAVGNIVASITVQQIGVTGTATRAGVLARFREAGEQFAARRVFGQDEQD